MPIWKFQEESTALPEASGEFLLDLAAYYQYTENFPLSLHTTDGIVTDDFQTPLQAIGWGSGELPLDLAAYHQYSGESLVLALYTSYMGIFNLPLDLYAVCEVWQGLSGEYEARGWYRQDIGVIFEAEDNVKTWDFALNLETTDGFELEDFSLDLLVLGTAPVFQANIAQRLSSVKTLIS